MFEEAKEEEGGIWKGEEKTDRRESLRGGRRRELCIVSLLLCTSIQTLSFHLARLSTVVLSYPFVSFLLSLLRVFVFEMKSFGTGSRDDVEIALRIPFLSLILLKMWWKRRSTSPHLQPEVSLRCKTREAAEKRGRRKRNEPPTIRVPVELRSSFLLSTEQLWAIMTTPAMRMDGDLM